LANDRRHRGALDDRLHLGLRRAEPALDDLARDRVAPHPCPSPRGGGMSTAPHRGAPARMTRLPNRSTRPRCPGSTTVVASSCSTIAGPTTTAPGPSAS